MALATWVSTINFWAWNMIGPLSTTYAEQMRLSSAKASLLVATPILVGALGRIAIGSLTDRFGGRAMFIAISLASIAPVLAVGLAGKYGSYPLLLVFGFFLGIAGTVLPSASRSPTRGTRPPAVGLPPACSAWAWWAPRCRRFSHHGSCAGSA
ncbi:hypothetical protein NIIDMKKI_64190 [Mycobacterium kansasii]|uniref:Major Facilitator Superfamily protein n=1 Tax=Mycobacterium kansasii TaxID=1768 RepID=A0A7G1IMY8_MYCKA|nr:hypothetical protein NIIDMKKI_64190 [Mycobacterium kansasii]